MQHYPITGVCSAYQFRGMSATLALAQKGSLSLALLHGSASSCAAGIPLDERFERLHGGPLAALLPPHVPVRIDDRSLEARLGTNPPGSACSAPAATVAAQQVQQVSSGSALMRPRSIHTCTAGRRLASPLTFCFVLLGAVLPAATFCCFARRAAPPGWATRSALPCWRPPAACAAAAICCSKIAVQRLEERPRDSSGTKCFRFRLTCPPRMLAI